MDSDLLLELKPKVFPVLNNLFMIVCIILTFSIILGIVIMMTGFDIRVFLQKVIPVLEMLVSLSKEINFPFHIIYPFLFPLLFFICIFICTFIFPILAFWFCLFKSLKLMNYRIYKDKIYIDDGTTSPCFVKYEYIKKIYLQQSLFQKHLNIGNIVFEVSFPNKSYNEHFVMRDIEFPQDIYFQLRKLKQNTELNKKNIQE